MLVTGFVETKTGFTVKGKKLKLTYKSKKTGKSTYKYKPCNVDTFKTKPRETRKTPIIVADFETDFVKVYKDDGSIDRKKSSAAVWLWIARPLQLPEKSDFDEMSKLYEETGAVQYKPDFKYVTDDNWKEFHDIGPDIESFCDYLDSYDTPVQVYFHNADFDYKFITYELINRGYHLAPQKPKGFKKSDKVIDITPESDVLIQHELDGEVHDVVTNKVKQFSDYEYDKMCVQQSIVNRRFYGATYYNKLGKKITILDSYKLSMNSIASLGKSIGKPKLEMDNGYHYRGPNYIPTENDLMYARRDVEVDADTLVNLLEIESGRTLGSRSYKQLKGDMYDSKGYDFRRVFPEYDLDLELRYFRDAYRGGYVYANPTNQNKDINNMFGSRIDKTSMHPSMMVAHKIPCGVPEPFKGCPASLTYTTNEYGD